MPKAARKRNQVTLAPTRLAGSDDRSENERLVQSRRERMARQRVQRLARERGDKKAVSAKPEAGETSPRLPQAHRRQC